jgi:hypothetical protein
MKRLLPFAGHEGPLRLRQRILSKRLYFPTRLYGVSSPKRAILNLLNIFSLVLNLYYFKFKRDSDLQNNVVPAFMSLTLKCTGVSKYSV